MDNFPTPGLGSKGCQSSPDHLLLPSPRNIDWFLSLPAHERDALISPGGISELCRAGNNAALMNQLFLEDIVPNLRNTLHGSHAGVHAPPVAGDFQAGSPIGFSETNYEVPHSTMAVSRSESQPQAPVQMDEDLIARQFAAKHRASFAQTLSNAKLEKWTRLCDVMLIKFFSDSGTQGTRPFFGWREDSYTEYITYMYESLLRREPSNYEYRAITIEVKDRAGSVRSISVHSTLVDSNFMDALQRMQTNPHPK